MFAKLVAKISCKVQKPKIYNKLINDSILSNRWREIINKL